MQRAKAVADRLVVLGSALGTGLRVQVLQQLIDAGGRAMEVSALVPATGSTLSLVAHHVRLLVVAGVVNAQKIGATTEIRIRPEWEGPLTALFASVEEFVGEESE